MLKKNWLYLLVIPMASFGVYYLADLLMEFQSDFGGLLIMGMLVIGWPATSAWLGCEAGKNLKKRWFLPLLFALTMVPVFPYYRAGIYAWLYAGVILLIGLITMIGTRVTE